MTTETSDDTTTNEVTNSLKDNAQNSEKADSGMDDDSQQSHEQDVHLSEDDNDILISRKSNQSKRILDEEEEDDENGTMVEGETTGTALSNAFDSGSEKNSDDEEEPLSTTLKRKKKRIANVFDDDSNDSTRGQSDEEKESMPQKKDPLFRNNDLFDAEIDENSQAGVEKSDNDGDRGDESDNDSGDDSNSSRENSGDEGFDESSIDPKLLAKLAKGASKKPSRSSKEKARKDERMNIHSETQRIVRESRVNLPYHQPEPKPLSDFLARASRKQELYRSLHKTRDIHKAKIMQETFEKDKMKKTIESSSGLLKQSPSEKKPQEGKECDTEEGKTIDGDSVLENVSMETQEKSALNDMQFGDDELPDLEEKDREIRSRLGQSEEPSQTTEEQSVAVGKDKQDTCNSQDSAINTDSASLDTQGEGSIELNEGHTEKTDIIEHKSETISQVPKAKDSRLPFLLEPDMPHLSAFPKLSGGPDVVISLDDEGEGSQVPQHPGVQKLMGRLMDHCKKRSKHVNKDVDIHIVEKDKDELHMKTFTYHPTQEGEEDSLQALDAPGAKLMALKEKLQEKMKVKREESRKQRQDIYDLDNEEVYEKEDEILDDDAEMSEHSDTDVEDDEFDEEFGEDEEMEEEMEEEDEREQNPFADDEAEEDEDEGDEDGENLKLHWSDDDDENDPDANAKTADEDDEDLAVTLKSSAKKKKKAQVLQISDDEESRDVAEDSYKPVEEEQKEESTKETTQTDKTQDKGLSKESGDTAGLFKEPDDELFMPFSRQATQATYGQEGRRTSSLIPPVEDSQDLYGSTPAIPSSCMDSQPSQSLNFYMEESQSRMFDADGFLRTGSTAKKPKSKPYMGFDMDSSQEDYDELLGLCSGRFQDGDNENKKGTCKQQLFGTQGGTQNNMEELMGLCSGRFGVSQEEGGSTQKTGLKRKSPLDEEEEEESNDSFKLVSDNEEETTTNRKGVFSDGDENDDNEDEDDERSRDSEKSRQKFGGFTVANKHGKIRKEFVEAEAELSGSEYDSDENLDLAEEEDVLELEEGDKDQVGTEEELRDQVGRAHLKQVIDEDKRELIRFQEMYLPDGDLHSEGQGRIRRFKWSNVDDTQQDMFNPDSDEDDNAEEDYDAKWRQERFEREKFLQEQEEKEQNEDENSHFLKFEKVFLKRSISEVGVSKKSSTIKLITKENTSLMASHAIFKPPMQRKGSFLGRDKQFLAKIADLTKSSINPTGPRNSRNFVFQVISPEKEANKQNSVAGEGKVRKAHKPKQPQQPAAKKPRLEKSASFPQNSIFNLM